LEETTGTTADNLDEDGAERPRLPRAVMDQSSRPGPEQTTLEAVGDQWRYALVVVKAEDNDDDYNHNCALPHYECLDLLTCKFGQMLYHTVEPLILVFRSIEIFWRPNFGIFTR